VRIAKSIWIGAVCALALTLTTSLTGCEVLLPASDPPATWIPLPTAGPSVTPTPEVWPTATPTPDPRPTATATRRPRPTATPTVAPEDTVGEGWAVATWARDLSWLALIEDAAHPEAPPEPSWEPASAETVSGETHFAFVAAPWTMRVTVPLTATEAAGYPVAVSGPEGYQWAASVQPTGEVMVIALEPTPAPVAVADWRGVIVALPAEAAYDDYVRIVGQPGGQYGIVGADGALAERIVALRDGQTVVRLWGTLLGQADDYSGDQIVVERIEVLPPPTVVPESEVVEGWQGVIRLLPADAAYDDYFDGLNPPGQHGIQALTLDLEEDLRAAAESERLVQIWGMLDHGVDDYGQRRILVTRIVVID